PVEGVFSPDARWIAVYQRFGVRKEEQLHIYDTKTGTEAKALNMPGRSWIHAVFFSAQSDRLAIVSQGFTYIYRVGSWETGEPIPIPSGGDIRFWDDGRMVEFQTREGARSVVVADVFTGEKLFERDDLPLRNAMYISKDYRRIAAITANDNAVQIWEVGMPPL